MGYLKYQLEGEQISFGNGEWFFTGNKRKSDKVVGRYTSSEGCEGQCNACNIVTARYSNGETYSIPYDCNAANSYFNFNSLLEINDYLPVSAITSLEFGDCVTRIDGSLRTTQPSFDSLTSITFSNSSSLKAIGESFLNVKAPHVTEIRLPSSLKILDDNTFASNMPNLERVILNDGIKFIGKRAFSGTKIRELVLPSTVEYIGGIIGMDKLRKVTFTNEIPPKSLGYNYSDLSIGAVYVPCGSVNEYKRVFHDTANYDFEERVTCEGAPFRIKYTMSDGFNVALPCNDGYVGSGETKDFIDEDVVNIEFSECTKRINTQFSGFTSLHDVSLTIPNANICRHAFENTSGITSLTIGSGCTFEITNATESTFASMPDLRRVTLEEGLAFGNVESMFARCASLTSVTIPNSIAAITQFMFSSCYSLASITIPNSVTRIGMYAFSGCTSLTNVNMSSNISIIDGSAFHNCSSLQEVVIPNTISGIGQNAFYGCTNLKSITIEATTPPTIFSYTFENTNNCPIYVPCDSVSSYVNRWGSLSARIRGIEPCNPDMRVHVTYIESSGLDDYIGYCDDTDMYIPNSNSAETVTYGDCVTSISNQAFIYKENLKSVTIPNSVTSIGQQAFQGCTSLTSIDIPDSVTSIGHSAFNGCSSLSSVTIGSGVTTIGTSVFSGCRSITSITIPDSVTNISDYAFVNCSGLTSVTIPDSVTSIGSLAFYKCSGLTSVTVESVTPPTLRDSNAFDYTNDCPIYVPATSVDVYKEAVTEGWSSYASRIQPIPNS